MSNSCVGCKYLCGIGNGYSDYTWMDTDAVCLKNKNPKLPDSEPYDWSRDAVNDNWPATQNGRCDLYDEGPYILVSPDGHVDEEPVDLEQAELILDYCEWELSTAGPLWHEAMESRVAEND